MRNLININMEKIIIKEGQAIQLSRRDITKDELEKLAMSMAIEDFNMNNHGIIFNDENDISKGTTHKYKTIKDVPPEKYNSFIDSYESVKKHVNSYHYNVYDIPAGIFIVGISIEPFSNKELFKFVVEWFIDKEGVAQDVSCQDFL